MSHSKEINETSIRQLQITHVEPKLYSDACSKSTQSVPGRIRQFPGARIELNVDPLTQLAVVPSHEVNPYPTPRQSVSHQSHKIVDDKTGGFYLD